MIQSLKRLIINSNVRFIPAENIHVDFMWKSTWKIMWIYMVIWNLFTWNFTWICECVVSRETTCQTLLQLVIFLSAERFLTWKFTWICECIVSRETLLQPVIFLTAERFLAWKLLREHIRTQNQLNLLNFWVLDGLELKIKKDQTGTTEISL